MKASRIFLLLLVVMIPLCIDATVATSQSAPLEWRHHGGRGHRHGHVWLPIPRHPGRRPAGYCVKAARNPSLYPKKMYKKLHLNASQQSAMDAIRQKYTPMFVDTLRSAQYGGASCQESLQEVQDLFKEMLSEMTCELSPQQIESTVFFLRKQFGKKWHVDIPADIDSVSGGYDETQRISAAIYANGNETAALESAVNQYYSALDSTACSYSRHEIGKPELAEKFISLRKDMADKIGAALPPDKQYTLASWMKGHNSIPEYLPINSGDIAAALHGGGGLYDAK